MVKPIESLAFAVHTSPRQFALLIGSGVSSAAGILTGWKITLDMVKQLAVLRGAGTLNDVEAETWFFDNYSTEPSYSFLIEKLARVPATRRDFLHTYFEPTEEERERGEKAPTEAHKAIAELAKNGFFGVIITTNFDALMEAALTTEGVSYYVVSDERTAKGAPPLSQLNGRVLLVKANGDYRDEAILNTASELDQYPQSLASLLGRILDEFGLIVCGWSGEYDTALRNLVLSTTSRRYSHYWSAFTAPTDRANALIRHREAEVVVGKSADEFFHELRELVLALQSARRPHPLTAQAAIARLKKYLVDEKYRIEMEDLLLAEVDRVISTVQKDDFQKALPPKFLAAQQSAGQINHDAFEEALDQYFSCAETLIQLAFTGGYWAKAWHYPIWEKVLRRMDAAIPVAPRTFTGNQNDIDSFRPIYNLREDSKQLPYILTFFALCLGGLAPNRYDIGVLNHLRLVQIDDPNPPHAETVLTLKAYQALRIIESGTSVTRSAFTVLSSIADRLIKALAPIEDIDRIAVYTVQAVVYIAHQNREKPSCAASKSILDAEGEHVSIERVRRNLDRIQQKNPTAFKIILGTSSDEETLCLLDRFSRK